MPGNLDLGHQNRFPGADSTITTMYFVPRSLSDVFPIPLPAISHKLGIHVNEIDVRGIGVQE